MDRKVGIFSVLALVFIFGTYGTAWADGGGKQHQCPTPLPKPPYHGDVINGTFTATHEGNTYHIQAILQKEGVVHAHHYYHPDTLGENNPICKYTDIQYILKVHQEDPCGEKVAEMFGLKGVVSFIESLEIISRDECKDEKKAIISGTVKIRVEPVGR